MFSTSSSQTLWPTSSMSWRLSWKRRQMDQTSGEYRSMSLVPRLLVAVAYAGDQGND